MTERAVGAPAGCLFCGDPGRKRTKEHVWRRALRDRFPEIRSLSFWQQTDADSNVQSRPISAFDMTVNAVCSDCNSGWLNDLENLALPAIEFFAAAVGTPPSREQIQDLAFWAATRALLRTHYSPAGHAPESMFRAVFDLRAERRVPVGFLISIAPTAPVALEAGTHQSARLDGAFAGHVAVSWGALLISVFLAEPEPAPLESVVRAQAQRDGWFPDAFWRVSPVFEPPPRPIRTLQPRETVVAASALGFMWGQDPRDQFGVPLDLDVVPESLRGDVPWADFERA